MKYLHIKVLYKYKMKVTIQTLDRVCVEITFDDSDSPTILQLKEKIHEIKNHPIDQIKLIFEAQVLSDNNKLLSEYGVVDGKRVVAMLQKNKPKQVQSQPQTTPMENKPVSQPVQPSFTNVSDWQDSDVQPDIQGNMNNMFASVLQQNPQVFMQLLMADPQIQAMAQQDPDGFNQFINDPNFLNNIINFGNSDGHNCDHNCHHGSDSIDDSYDDEYESNNHNHQHLLGGTVPLSPEQKLEVEDIVSMGFGTFEDTIQYYFAMNCDKEATVNALLDNKFSGDL